LTERPDKPPGITGRAEEASSMDTVSAEKEELSAEEPEKELLEDPFDPQPGPVQLRKSVRILFRNYRNFLPGILLMLVCPFLPVFLWKLAFFLVFGSFLTAAASHALGYLKESPLKVMTQRFPSHLWNATLFALFCVLAATPAMLFVSLISSEYPTLPETARALILLGGTVPFITVVFFRFWPALFITFTCTASETRRTVGGLWVGPGIRTVRSLTALEEAATNHTLPLFKHTLLILGGFTGTYLALSGWESSAFLMTVVFYFLVLPLWILVLVRLGGELHRKWRDEQSQEDTEPQLVTEAAFKPLPLREKRGRGGEKKTASGPAGKKPESEEKEHVPDEVFTVVELTELERPASSGKGAWNPTRTPKSSEETPRRPSLYDDGP